MKNHWANSLRRLLPAACCLLLASISGLAQACTTDPLSQPAVISVQSTASTAPPASELACSSPIGDTVFLNARYFSFVTGKLEQVIITGSAIRNDNTVCVGESCQVVLTGLRDAGERAAAILGGWKEEIISVLFPPVTVVACTAVTPAPPGSYGDPRTTTSRSDDNQRAFTAGVVMRALYPIVPPGKKDAEIKVVFSDGGSQTYILSHLTRPLEKQPTDLQEGDGVSKCPP